MREEMIVISEAERTRDDEQGYTLLALLALMTIMMLALVVAAPNLKQAAQREKELETIRRGEQVAEAIRLYMNIANGQPPASFEELIKGASKGTKKVQVLRRSSARELLSEKGEWRLIKEIDPALRRFCADVTRYAGSPPLNTTDIIGASKTVLIRAHGTAGCSLPPLPISALDADADELPGSTSGPFIGVVSSSKDESIISYYGIEKHNRWIFTPLLR